MNNIFNITLIIVFFTFVHLSSQEKKIKQKIQNPHMLHIDKLYKEKKYQEAIHYLIKLLEKQKSNQVYHLLISVSFSKLKNDQKAFEYLRRGYLHNPTTIYARKKMLPILNYLYNNFKNHEKFPWLNKYYKIKKLFDENKLPQAETLALKLLEDNTNTDLTAILCKDIKTIQGKASSFDSTLRKVINTLGNNCPEYIFFELGETLYNSGKFEHAIKSLETAMKMNKFRRRSGALYGASLLYTGSYARANSALSNSLKLFPKFSETRLYYALSFWALNKSSKAIDELDSILNKNTPSKILKKAKGALKVIKAGEIFLTPEMMQEVMKYLPKGADPLIEIKKKINALDKSEKIPEKK